MVIKRTETSSYGIWRKMAAEITEKRPVSEGSEWDLSHQKSYKIKIETVLANGKTVSDDMELVRVSDSSALRDAISNTQHIFSELFHRRVIESEYIQE